MGFGWFGLSTFWLLALCWPGVRGLLGGEIRIFGPGTLRMLLGVPLAMVSSATLAALTGGEGNTAGGSVGQFLSHSLHLALGGSLAMGIAGVILLFSLPLVFGTTWWGMFARGKPVDDDVDEPAYESRFGSGAREPVRGLSQMSFDTSERGERFTPTVGQGHHTVGRLTEEPLPRRRGFAAQPRWKLSEEERARLDAMQPPPLTSRGAPRAEPTFANGPVNRVHPVRRPAGKGTSVGRAGAGVAATAAATAAASAAAGGRPVLPRGAYASGTSRGDALRMTEFVRAEPGLLARETRPTRSAPPVNPRSATTASGAPAPKTPVAPMSASASAAAIDPLHSTSIAGVTGYRRPVGMAPAHLRGTIVHSPFRKPQLGLEDIPPRGASPVVPPRSDASASAADRVSADAITPTGQPEVVKAPALTPTPAPAPTPALTSASTPALTPTPTSTPAPARSVAMPAAITRPAAPVIRGAALWSATDAATPLSYGIAEFSPVDLSPKDAEAVPAEAVPSGPTPEMLAQQEAARAAEQARLQALAALRDEAQALLQDLRQWTASDSVDAVDAPAQAPLSTPLAEPSVASLDVTDAPAPAHASEFEPAATAEPESAAEPTSELAPELAPEPTPERTEEADAIERIGPLPKPHYVLRADGTWARIDEAPAHDDESAQSEQSAAPVVQISSPPAVPAIPTFAAPAPFSVTRASEPPSASFSADTPYELAPPRVAVDYDLPSVDLLSPATPQDVANVVSDEALAAVGQLIEQRLAEFKVPVTVVGASAGPVITRFEVEPAVGVRGAQVVGLVKDLARALGVTSIRVVETIPGKTCMGLELPNAQRQMIRLSEILTAPVFDTHRSHLALAMGKDITGEPVVADLARAPHLLVAGTTGSGKSVAVNAMILSLLYKATPDDVRLIMIDPKMLELSVYGGIPHLLAPVVTDMKQAAHALNWCVGEMEKRYRLMSALGVRNLAGYNEKIDAARAAGTKVSNPFSLTPDAPEPLERLPFIVVVIDELADLMMVAGKKIEELIARLAQKARAAGIHLILATQRPSVDVITGLIKANIPTRVAFQVSSKIDSRTILDQMGAESLLGQGDMLFLPPGTGYPQRVHGAFVADDEVHRVVQHWQQYGEPDYDEAILAGDPGDAASADLFGESTGDAEADPLYDEAAAFVLNSRRASISAVQRQLRIGYNRAARLIEQMEAAGLVSPMGRNGAREVTAPGD
jgi:S-DNA-T family DNA segregation ATPase FtsK/SpoIIIE